MAKKNFKSGIDSLIQPSIIEQKTDNKKSKKESFVKATYYYHAEQLEKVKAMAYYERKAIGKVISDALELYINKCEHLEDAIKVYSNVNL
jgi:hypothetical protein